MKNDSFLLPLFLEVNTINGLLYDLFYAYRYLNTYVSCTYRLVSNHILYSILQLAFLLNSIKLNIFCVCM